MNNEKAKNIEEQIETEDAFYMTGEQWDSIQFPGKNSCMLSFDSADEKKLIKLLKDNNIPFEKTDISKAFYYDRAYRYLECTELRLRDPEDGFWSIPVTMSEEYFDEIVRYLSEIDPVLESDIIQESMDEYMAKRGCRVDK